MFQSVDPIDLIDPAWRRLHPGRQLFSMFADIVAQASFVVGLLWGALMVPWVDQGHHVQAIAETAESFGLAACMWAISARLFPCPWQDQKQEPTP